VIRGTGVRLVTHMGGARAGESRNIWGRGRPKEKRGLDGGGGLLWGGTGRGGWDLAGDTRKKTRRKKGVVVLGERGGQYSNRKNLRIP